MEVIMDKLKTVKVKNNSNVLVQVPKVIVDKWGLQNGDSIEVILTDGGDALILKPRRGYYDIKPVFKDV